MESIRIKQIQTPVIPIIGQWIKANPGTISLGQGVVNYGPPEEALKYMTDYFSEPHFHIYKLAEGIHPLLDVINDKLEIDNNIIIDQDKNIVFVTAGANMAFLNSILTITDPGDEIIILSPYYFNYEMAIGIVSCTAVVVPTDSNYHPDLDLIRNAITKKTRAIVTISPNNPTGVVYPAEKLQEINELCREQNIYHISDEAYEYFTYDNIKHFSSGSIKDSENHTISIFSLSKAYGMASWRIGFVILPKHLEMAFKKVQDTNLICAPVVSQYAAAGAMTVGSGYCMKYVKLLHETRKLVLENLNSLGNRISYSHPDGAFYVFIRVNNTALNSMELVKKLIYKYKVALVPGSAFGFHKGCYIRLAYGALDNDSFSEGMGRFMKGIIAED